MMIYTADNQHFEPKRFVVYRCFSFLTVVFSGSSRWFSGEVNLTCSILWGELNACIPKSCSKKHLLLQCPQCQTIHRTGITFAYVYHKNQPNVRTYTIHGWFGMTTLSSPNLFVWIFDWRTGLDAVYRFVSIQKHFFIGAGC